MKNVSKNWSVNLLEQTFDALDDYFTGPDGFLHMKNINGNFGKILLEDLIARRLLIQDKNSDVKYLYKTADELIADGWVID